MATAAVGLALNGALAASFLVLGGTGLRDGVFPAPGYGLPWRSRRLTGRSARVVGAFMLFAAILTLPWIWIEIRVLETAVSLQ